MRWSKRRRRHPKRPAERVRPLLGGKPAPHKGEANERPKLCAYDGLIVDLDGVVWLGDRPIDGVADALRSLRANGVKVLFVTNDPEHSRSAQVAELFATGRDPFVPTSDGREPGTGAILAAIETATGATATITGKPEPHMFGLASELLAGCARIAVVGDNPSGDIGGARRAGLDAILVLSGVTRQEALAFADVRPDLVLPTLAALCT